LKIHPPLRKTTIEEGTQNIRETTSFDRAAMPIIFSPIDWDDGREDPPTSVEGMTTPLGRRKPVTHLCEAQENPSKS